MYSNEKNVQILLSLLKEYRIKEVVLSPGGSDAPIVKSFENDDYFTCYSVVDERSSVFFGIGLSQEKGVPVICVCTSGTAVSNFLSGITEAYYQDIPIIAVTSDSHPYNLDQLELQKLNQDNIFKNVIRKEITLPTVKNDMDEWHCNRIINEALLELDHHGSGPIHINIPITQTLQCSTPKLPIQRVIKREYVYKADYKYYAEKLLNKKILVVVGENSNINSHEIELLNMFYKKYNCVFNIESISNLRCDGCITTYPLTETDNIIRNMSVLPDIVISIGNFIASYQLKPLLRLNRHRIENWLIHENGAVRDPYWSLSIIFEGSHDEFFEKILSINIPNKSIHSYYKSWEKAFDKLEIGELGFSSIGIAKVLSETIPNNSILHTAILNSTRVMQFFPPKNKVKCYCNLGALGIDGCTATAIGHSMATDKLTYLFTGDLSFFYGMNAISIRGVKNNLRIILCNNGGGEEFKIKLSLPELDEYVCARSNHRVAKGWVESLGFGYYSCNSLIEVENVLNTFAKPSDKPLFLEVMLDMDKDSDIIKKIYSKNRSQSTTMGKIKNETVKILPKSIVESLKKIIK